MTAHDWLIAQGTMADELAYARAEVPRLRAAIEDLSSGEATDLCLGRLRVIAIMAEEGEDWELAQIGTVLRESIDAVRLYRRMLEERGRPC